MKKKSIGSVFSMCVQPTFIVGTYNEDGTQNFAPITWISVTCEQGTDYLIVISMYGTKKTKQNVIRAKYLSLNLVSCDMLPLVDYFGHKSAKNGVKNEIPYKFMKAETVEAPILDASPWVYECEVVKTVNTNESDTFFCKIHNVQIAENIDLDDNNEINLMKFNPVIYSSQYFCLGKRLGRIGDFLPKE